MIIMKVYSLPQFEKENVCSLYSAEYSDGEHHEDKVEITEIHEKADTAHEHSDAAGSLNTQPAVDQQERLPIPDGEDDQQNEANPSTHDHEEECSHGSISGVTSVNRRDILEALEKEAPSEEGDPEHGDLLGNENAAQDYEDSENFDDGGDASNEQEIKNPFRPAA